MNSEPEIDSPLPTNPIRVETAISRYPVHRLARKGSIKIDLKEADDRGELTLNWKVSYNSEYGQPGPLAYKLDTLIINRRIEEASRPIPRILKLGSLHDICKELGIADSGKNRTDIKKALYQNAFAGIKAKTKYRLADGTEHSLEAGFTRYSVVFTGEKLPDGRKADGVYIILNDVFTRVINGAMTRPLDYDYLKELPPAAQRFYELLSYQVYAALKWNKPRAKLVYSEFCAHAPMTRHFDWERVRSQMNKVHRLHRQSGYIAQVDYQQTADGQGRPDWLMYFAPGLKAKAEFRAFTKRGGPVILEVEPAPEEPTPLPNSTDLELFQTRAQDPLASELIARGVTKARAEELVQQFPPEHIRSKLDAFDWRVDKKDKSVQKNPAGFLLTSIENNYPDPKGFVSKAEQERRKKAADEAAVAREEEAERQRQKDAQKRREQDVVAAYWNSLAPQEQEKIDNLAKTELAKQNLAGPMLRLGIIHYRNERLREILEQQGTLTPRKVDAPADA